MMKSLVSLFLLLSLLPSQYNQIQSGPMLGYSEMRETVILVQTKKAAIVQIRYWGKGKRQIHFSDKIQTKKSDFYMAHLVLDELEPSMRYQYDVLLNDKKVNFPYKTEFQTQNLFQWREKIGIHPPEFSFVLGSCMYINEEGYDRPGTPYGRNYQTLTRIKEQNPDFMLWMGDNTYFREVDWYSRSGMGKRYTHSRSVRELQALLASTHHYAIWDDHDYGPNDSDKSFVHKNKSLELFKLFWGNPTYGLDEKDGIYTQFQWGDIDFFLTDNRWFRDANHLKNKKNYLGKKQLDWLINALAASKAPFKFVIVGSQVLNPLKKYELYANYAEERKELLDAIHENKIEGVIFASGDVHHSDVNKLIRKNAYPLYEITSSTLTAGIYKNNDYDKIPSIIRESVVNENNFALLKVSGKRSNRQVKMTYINSEGKELYSLSIHENELKYAKGKK